jgi:hypothetical protein
MTVTEGASGGVAGWLTPLAFLYGVAMETGIGVRDYPGADPHEDGTAAIVADGKLIALNSALADDGLRADVLAMALEVATVMTDRPGSRPGAIYAPGGFVVITGNRIPAPPAGAGTFATFMARKSGRDTTSAAFEYYIPQYEYHIPQSPRRRPLQDAARNMLTAVCRFVPTRVPLQNSSRASGQRVRAVAHAAL